MPKRYIALLRGINVGGHIVKMEILRKLFEELGFEDVGSFIQSGNVFFTTNPTLDLQKRIEKKLEHSFGFSVPAVIRTVEEMENIIRESPFSSLEKTPETRYSISFLSKEPAIKLQVPYVTSEGGYEVIKSTKKELFIIWHLINGRPGRSYGLIEKQLNVPITTRFFHTAEKILKASRSTNL